ncbi:ferredoxin [Streptomyces sp. NPDC057702]|uniref:ferredoxin n=1 Tax=unclassified Streptomyces TaxID=2593676 RepID=UPI00368A02FF
MCAGPLSPFRSPRPAPFPLSPTPPPHPYRRPAMKVVVDMNTCQDHGQCVFAAPEVFHFDDTGHLAYLAHPDDGLSEAVEEAADVCPLQAIRIED